MTARNGASTMTVAAILLAFSTFASRILGYLRDVIIATTLGASAETDAYYAAFGLPDLLVYFLAGGALSIAFVPIFQRLQAQRGDAAAWALFRNIGTTGTLLFGVGLFFGYLYTPQIVSLLVPAFSEAQHALTVRLTRVILPTPVFFFLGGLLGATEIAAKRFRSTALAPLVYNACIILGGLLLAPWLGVEGFSWGVLAGAVLGPFGTHLFFARKHVDLRPYLRLTDVELRRYLWVALPLMLGVSLTTVDEWIGRFFASGLAEGSISWLNNARRLMLFPIALLGQAIGQAALPFLSSLANDGDDEGLHAALSRALASTALLSVAVAMGLAALSGVAAGLVYGYGAYGDTDVAATGALLAGFCLAIPAWSLQAVAARGFYARSHTWTPMLASTVAVLAAIPLYYALQERFDVLGLALAAGAAITGQYALLLVVYRVNYKRSLWGVTLSYSARGALAALPGALLAGWLATRFWSPGAPFGTTLVVAIGASVAFALPTLPALVLLGGESAAPVTQRLEKLRAKLRR